MATVEMLMARLEACEAEISALRSAKQDAAKQDAAKQDAKTSKKSSKEPSSPKEKKTSTSCGPTEWNLFVKTTMREMAAAKGVLYDAFFAGGDVDGGDAAFKTAAKEVGVNWQGALKEAARRKNEMEGRDPAEEQAKKEAKKAAAAAKKEPKEAKEAKPKEAKPKKEKKAKTPEPEADAEADFEKELAASNMVFKTIAEVRYIFDNDSSEVYETTGTTFGDRVGIFDTVTGEIDRSA